MQLNSLQSMHSHGHQPAFFMGFGAKSFGSDFPLEVLPGGGGLQPLVTVDAKVQLCIGCELQRKEIYVVEFSHSALETKRLI